MSGVWAAARVRIASAHVLAGARSQMLQAAAAFGGGLWVKAKLDELPLPRLRHAPTDESSFRLSVRILSASIPKLGAPGMVTRQRPRLVVTLGSTQKQTELADFAGGSPGNGAGANECPWRFGDTLTFVACLDDVLGPGVHLQLQGYSDVRLGPLQVDLGTAVELGQATVDLRQRVLPACVMVGVNPDSCVRGMSIESLDEAPWESPTLVIPLTRVCGGITASPSDSPCVAVAFSINTDPERVLREADEASRPLYAKVSDRLSQSLRSPQWLNCGERYCRPDSRESSPVRLKPLPVIDGCGACSTPVKSPVRPKAPGVLECPDQAPEGWVCYRAANGRTFWHHLALGPPPWERSPGFAQTSRDARSIPSPCGGNLTPPHYRVPPSSAPELDLPRLAQRRAASEEGLSSSSNISQRTCAEANGTHMSRFSQQDRFAQQRHEIAMELRAAPR